MGGKNKPDLALASLPDRSTKHRYKYDESSVSSDDSEESTRPSNIHVFSASSTLHGFSHIFALHHSSLRRFAWTVAFLTSFTLFLLQSSNRVIYYLNSPHVTRIDEVTAGNLSFPAVTICNVNELRFSKLTQNDVFHVGRLLGFLDENDTLIRPQYYNQADHPRLYGVMQRMDWLSDFGGNFIPNGEFNMSEFYHRAGHDIEDILLNCKYRGSICNHTWFTEDRQPKPSDFVFFAANSTLHGINHIFTNGRFTFRKALWAIAFTASLFFFLFQAYDRYTYYSSRPHVTKLDEQEATEINFPAVTICNLNSFRLSAVSTDDYFHTGKDILRLFNEDYLLKSRQFRDNRTWPAVKRKIWPILKDRKKYQPLVNNFNMSEFYDRTGHRVDEMVVNCKYRGTLCTRYDDWTTVFTRYGKCYTFNSGKKYDPLKTLKGGIDNGLELLLDTQQNEYMPVWDETDEISVEAGFKVQLHVQSEPPFIHELGFGVSPGFQSLVATQEQRITFLPSPWGNCVKDFDKSYHAHFDNYSISGCRITCETRFVMSNCNCRMVHMPGDAPFCNPEQYRNCADKALDYLVKEDDKICVCETPCEVTRYNLETSMLRLPSTQALSYLAYKYRKSEDYVRENFVKLNIFFEALNYETIEQKVAYEIPGLFGDIGGQMGLFIGASILTLLELFNYLYEVVKDKTWGKKLRKARRQAANESLRRELQHQRELNNGYKLVSQNDTSEERSQLPNDPQTPCAYNNKLSPLQEFNTSNFAKFNSSEFPPPPEEYVKPEEKVQRFTPSSDGAQLSRRSARGGKETSMSYNDLYRTSDRDWRNENGKPRFNHSQPPAANPADSGFGGSAYLGGQFHRQGEVPMTPLSVLTNPSIVTSPVHQFHESSAPSVETDIH